MPGGSIIPDDYYAILARIESGNNPNAKAPTSSASGLFQFTQSTFQRLGFDWSNVFDVNTQHAAAQKLTASNANVLTRNGISTDSASLYAAHFLGAGDAVKVLGSDNSTPLDQILDPKVFKANSFLNGMNVGDFKSWLGKKVGVGQGSHTTTYAGKDVEVTDNVLDNVLHSFGVDTSGIDSFFTSIDPSNIGATAAKATGTEDIFKFLGNLLSVNTAMRATAIIIGGALVIVAVVYLTNSDKLIVDGAKALAA